ncbi:MAG TPA: hypothetical protein DEE98_01495 [Elusimicrobia bacterium]|nr:hypothetical protein [Elusimicrobiota bacterium]
MYLKSFRTIMINIIKNFVVLLKLFSRLIKKIIKYLAKLNKFLGICLKFLAYCLLCTVLVLFVFFCYDELNNQVEIKIQPFVKEFEQSEKGYSSEMLRTALLNNLRVIGEIKNVGRIDSSSMAVSIIADPRKQTVISTLSESVPFKIKTEYMSIPVDELFAYIKKSSIMGWLHRHKIVRKKYYSVKGYIDWSSKENGWIFEGNIEESGRGSQTFIKVPWMKKEKAILEISENIIRVVDLEAYCNYLGDINNGWAGNTKLLKELNNFILIHPNNALAYYYLGLCNLYDRKYNESILNFEKAIRYDSKLLDAYVVLGQVYFARGDIDKAEKSLRGALKINRHNAPALTVLGRIYNRVGKFSKAEKYLLRAARVNEGLVEGHGNFGDEFAVPYYLLGIVRSNQKQIDKSIESFKKAIKYDPKFSDAYRELGAIYYIHIKDTDTAISYLVDAISSNKKNIRAYNDLSVLYLGVGDLKKARFYVNQVLQLDPKDLRAHNILAEVNSQENDRNSKKYSENISTATTIWDGVR